MKNIMFGLIFALLALNVSWGQEATATPGNMVKAVVYVTAETKPVCCGADWKAYEKADKDSKAAKLKGDFIGQAEKTPFAWVAAWAYFNDGRVKAKAKKFDEAEKSFKLSENLIEPANSSGLAPALGPNTMDNLKNRIGSFRKWMADVTAHGEAKPQIH